MLGTRQREACEALPSVEGRTASQILGGLDAIKGPVLDDAVSADRAGRAVDGGVPTVLDRYFDAEAGPATDLLLAHG